MPLRELFTDTDYTNGSKHAWRGSMTWIFMFGQYKAETADFTYDASTDARTCAAGKAQPFRKYDADADGG